MKKFLPLLLINSLVVILFFALSSCEGPEGPKGADGAAGTAGTNGTNGLNGKDANSFCKVCHNNANMDAKAEQWATSRHGSGTSWATEGTRNTCAACHSQAGYIETTFTGRDTMAVTGKIGLPLGCEGCHEFHNTLDSNEFPDYALQYSGPVKLRMRTSISINLPKANGCIKCHQARLPSPNISSMTGTDTITATSYRWGIHYGGTGSIFAGVGGGCYEFPGVAYENTAHTTTMGCGDCHMAKYMGSGVNSAGGHTFRMVDTNDTENLVSCKVCHPTATSFDVNGKQTEIKGLLKQLGDKLFALGLIEKDPVLGYTGYVNLPHSGSGLKLKFPSKVGAAIINYQHLIREGSAGVHNYKYTKALLTNTIASLP